MIKPEEIPDELVEELLRPRKSGDWKQQIADDLNAAIEAGVVSPPCWAVRDEFGCVVTQRRVFTARQFAEEAFTHRPGCVVEHWKGQTE